MNTCILLVEGWNDRCVVTSLCKYYNVEENFNIEPCNGIDNVLKRFKLMLGNPSAYRRIGIMVDADTDITKRWNQVIGILKRSGKYDCSNHVLPTGGLVLHPRDSHDSIIGIWIMPDNQLNGMLEDFVAQLASPGDVLMKKANSVLNELEVEKIQRYKAVHRPKAQIHTFLAWQDEPGYPMGTAITKKILNPGSGQAKPFIEWLEKLFIV
ncbi:MAG: hypothetical protein MdMp024_1846 [Bacteroidales bacterium]